MLPEVDDQEPVYLDQYEDIDQLRSNILEIERLQEFIEHPH